MRTILNLNILPMSEIKSDLTVVYYTADQLPKKFSTTVFDTLWDNLEPDAPPPIEIHKESSVAPSHFGIYRQALQGAKWARTKYIALCEDDVLYSPEHFKYRPKKAPFAYNMNFWNIHTWGEPVFTQKSGGRRNLGQLICDRQAFITAMEERFAKYPDPADDLKPIWAEPSKYENQLGVTSQDWEAFHTNPPNIMFSHQTSLSYQGLGERKRLGEIRATEIPSWGHAKDIRKLYE